MAQTGFCYLAESGGYCNETKRHWRDYFLYLNVLHSSGISRKLGAMTVRYSGKKECVSFVFYCFENLSIAGTLESLVRFIQVGFSTKCISPNEDFNQIENKMSHVRLPTDSPRSHSHHKYDSKKVWTLKPLVPLLLRHPVHPMFTW